MEIETLFGDTNPTKNEIRIFASNLGLEYDVMFSDVALGPEEAAAQAGRNRGMGRKCIINIETTEQTTDLPAQHMVFLPEQYLDEEGDKAHPEKLTPEDHFMLAKAGIAEFNVLLGNEPPIISNISVPEPRASRITLNFLEMCERTSDVWALDLLYSRGYSHIVEKILIDRQRKLLERLAEKPKDDFQLKRTICDAAFNDEMFFRFQFEEGNTRILKDLENKCVKRAPQTWEQVQSLYGGVPLMPSYEEQIIPILNQVTSRHTRILAGKNLSLGYLSATKLHQGKTIKFSGGEYVWMHNEFYTGYKKPYIRPLN